MANESGEDDDEKIRQLHRQIADGIVNLGVARDFYLKLMHNEDDWSFVIKLHALLEGVVNSYLAREIANPKMTTILERLSFDRRLELVVAASRLTEQEGKVIRTVAALRNQLAHRAANTSFSFTAAEGQVREKVLACVNAVIEMFGSWRKGPDRRKPTPFMEHAKRDPKGTIWLVLALTISDWAEANATPDITWQAVADVLIAHVDRELGDEAMVSREQRQQLFLAVVRLERHLSDVGFDEFHPSRNRLTDLRAALCARAVSPDLQGVRPDEAD